jgi:hypothetical protein
MYERRRVSERDQRLCSPFGTAETRPFRGIAFRLVPNQALYQAEPRPELSNLACCTPAHKHVPSNS